MKHHEQSDRCLADKIPATKAPPVIDLGVPEQRQQLYDRHGLGKAPPAIGVTARN